VREHDLADMRLDDPRDRERVARRLLSLGLGDEAGERHVRIRARGTSGQVAGAARYTNGLAAHKSDRPARPAFSLEAPVPENAPTLPAAPDVPVRSLEDDSHAGTPLDGTWPAVRCATCRRGTSVWDGAIARGNAPALEGRELWL
jgi:hypothetical protein